MKKILKQIYTTQEIAERIDKNQAYTLRLIKENLIEDEHYRATGPRGYLITDEGLDILKKYSVSRFLQKVSSRFFVENYEELKKMSLGEDINILQDHNLTENSQNSYIRESRKIFLSKLNREALEFISREDSNADKQVKNKAINLLQESK